MLEKLNAISVAWSTLECFTPPHLLPGENVILSWDYPPGLNLLLFIYTCMYCSWRREALWGYSVLPKNPTQCPWHRLQPRLLIVQMVLCPCGRCSSSKLLYAHWSLDVALLNIFELTGSLQFVYDIELYIISRLICKYRSWTLTTGFTELLKCFLFFFLPSVLIVEAVLKRTVVVITW